MDKKDARNIARILEAYGNGAADDPRIVERLSAEPLQGFHHWADGHDLAGGFLVESAGWPSLWLLLIDWNESSQNGFYAVLFPRDKSGPVAEIHQASRHPGGDTLTWRYRPSKKDGRNADRKAYFEKHFGSLEVTLSLPRDVDDAQDFLVDLLQLADSRCKADSLDARVPDYREGFPEGRQQEKLHLRRERNSALIREIKQEALRRDGTLTCACCGFDFEAEYGDIGKGFIEAHHSRPVSELDPDGDETRKEDIALVCSNCHRMLHRRRPWLSMSALKTLRKNTR